MNRRQANHRRRPIGKGNGGDGCRHFSLLFSRRRGETSATVGDGGDGCRSDLTASQRAKAIKRRKDIWESLHPEGGNTVPTLGGNQQVGFAADTCAASGLTKRSVNEHLSRAAELGTDLDAVYGTSLDKGGRHHGLHS